MAVGTRKVTCRKCRGTGTVERFLDYKGGVCFDCDGTGRVAHIAGGKSKLVRVNVADLEVGLRVRATNKTAAETVVDFHRHPDLPAVTVVITNVGEYRLSPAFTPTLVLA